MIKAILVFNVRGQARLLKFFDSCSIEAQQQLVRQSYQLISKRDPLTCNFVEFNEHKLIYRQYATLYFVAVIDSTESELETHEFIHVFVQCLDQYFENVCELDLIFHSDKANQIVNEVFMGGFIVQQSANDVINDMRAQTRLEREDTGVFVHVGTKIKSAIDSQAEKIKMDVGKRFEKKL
jgi:AP-3 complex subunit sigma